MHALIDDLIDEVHVNKPIILNAPLFHVSSTLIRESVLNEKNIHGLVPESVEEYIRKHNLYTLK